MPGRNYALGHPVNSNRHLGRTHRDVFAELTNTRLRDAESAREAALAPDDSNGVSDHGTGVDHNRSISWLIRVVNKQT